MNIDRETADKYQGLFNYLNDQYGINPTIEGMKDLIAEVEKTKQLLIPRVSNCAVKMPEILDEAIRREANYAVQYADYSLETWTVANKLNNHRKENLLTDGSVRKVRIEYEM